MMPLRNPESLERLHAIAEHKAAAAAELQDEQANGKCAGDALNGAAGPWLEPVSLENHTLPPLPPGALPGILGEMSCAVAEALEVPLELSATIGLGTLSASCHGAYIIEGGPGYREPLSLWLCPALESGNRKTGATQAMTAPLSQWERAKAEEMSEQVRQNATERDNIEARIKRLRGKLAGKENDNERNALTKQIHELVASMPPKITVPRVWAQDITPEGLPPLMAANGGRMAIISDEGGLFGTMAGRYSNGVPNLDVFLQGHAGSPIRIDRKGSESVCLDSSRLSITLSPQPAVLAGLSKTKDFRGRGLLARFAFFLPPSTLGYRSGKSDPIPVEISRRWAETITCLLEGQYNAREEREPTVLTLSPKARDAWRTFERTVEVELREGGRFANLKDWAGKLPGLALRLAGVMHCCLSANIANGITEVAPETMDCALQVAAVAQHHALAAFDMMQADPDLEAARHLLAWIKRTQSETFTFRDAFEGVKGRYPKTNQLEPAFDVLLERQYLRELDREKRQGRPSRRFNVNPRIWGATP